MRKEELSVDQKLKREVVKNAKQIDAMRKLQTRIRARAKQSRKNSGVQG